MVSSKTKRSRVTDEELLSTILDYSGLSLYELRKRLKWTSGKVDGSLNRLIKKKKVFVKLMERGGRRVKLVYPIEMIPSTTIKVKEENLVQGNPLWMDIARIYALDLHTIGIAGRNVTEWQDISAFYDDLEISHENGFVSLQLPEAFVRFYDLNHKHFVVTINSNNLLLTVSGDLVVS